MTASVAALIKALDTDDVRAQNRAGNQLAAAGPQAIPTLIDALFSAAPHVRKSAAFLLGTHRTAEEVVTALGRVVTDDPEPKVRKNAAVSLGRIGAPQAVDALVTALQQETVGWVRPSLILALGAIGGEAACAVLHGLTAANEAERDALHKAVDRCDPRSRAVDWRREAVRQPTLLLEVPVGLETVALDEAAERGIRPVTRVQPGLLRCPPGLPPWTILPALRCVYGQLIDAGHGPSLPVDRPGECAAAVAALVAGSSELIHSRDWLQSEDEVIKYRFALDHRVRRETLRATLEAVRVACRPIGLIDSPSNYDVELRVSTSAAGSSLLIRPSFAADTRFAYRQKDVGASINPVVAACLARLVRSSPEATVFDPTCGSGTLLVERALLDEHVHLVGLDISRTAVSAAKTNVKAAGLEGRVQILEGDATRMEWPACDEVIANLPFGMRTQRAEMDLGQLYGAVLAQLAARLRPGGRAVLYTTNRKLLESSLPRHKDRLRVDSQLRVLAGGLWSNVWILTARR